MLLFGSFFGLSGFGDSGFTFFLTGSRLFSLFLKKMLVRVKNVNFSEKFTIFQNLYF